MSPEHEQTWRDLVAEQVEQKRRADLFPDLVRALDDLLTVMGEGNRRGRAIDLVDRRYTEAALAVLIRCRKPKP